MYVVSHQNIKYLVEVISYGVNHQKKVHHPLFHRMTTRHVHVSDVNEREKIKNERTGVVDDDVRALSSQELLTRN